MTWGAPGAPQAPPAARPGEAVALREATREAVALRDER